MANKDLVLCHDAPNGLEGVRLLTLNRPTRRNALNSALMKSLDQALRKADSDRDVRCVVLTGAGDKAFCAGGDLSDGMQAEGFLPAHEERGIFAQLLSTFRHLKTPTIAAVNGAALGGGLGLVLSCDLAVAAKEARLGTPELKLGLFPMMIGRLLYEVLPRKAANELIFLGESVDGLRACELGMVNKSVPEGQVLEASLKLAEQITRLSPAALGLGRQALNRQLDMSFEAAMAYLHNQLALNLQCEDAAEGVAAFLEKREAKFSGK